MDLLLVAMLRFALVCFPEDLKKKKQNLIFFFFLFFPFYLIFL